MVRVNHKEFHSSWLGIVKNNSAIFGLRTCVQVKPHVKLTRSLKKPKNQTVLILEGAQTKCAYFPQFHSMCEKRAHTLNQKSLQWVHWPWRINYFKFSSTWSQPSKGQNHVGREALAQPDLWGSSSKQISNRGLTNRHQLKDDVMPIQNLYCSLFL